MKLDGKKVKLIGDIGANSMLIDVTDAACCVGDCVTIECRPQFVKGIPVEYR